MIVGSGQGLAKQYSSGLSAGFLFLLSAFLNCSGSQIKCISRQRIQESRFQKC